MFKAIKEFFFGKPQTVPAAAPQVAPEAPYKVETPVPVEVVAPAPIEVAAPVKAVRKPRANVAAKKIAAAKKPAAPKAE
jgi:hypothetical protein